MRSFSLSLGSHTSEPMSAANAIERYEHLRNVFPHSAITVTEHVVEPTTRTSDLAAMHEALTQERIDEAEQSVVTDGPSYPEAGLHMGDPEHVEQMNGGITTLPFAEPVKREDLRLVTVEGDVGEITTAHNNEQGRYICRLANGYMLCTYADAEDDEYIMIGNADDQISAYRWLLDDANAELPLAVA